MFSKCDFDNLSAVVMSVHRKGFLETCLTFELPASFITFLFSIVIWCMFTSSSRQNQTVGGDENLLIQASVPRYAIF